MAKNKVPVGLIDAEMYFNGSNNLAGIGEIELPKIEIPTIPVEQFGMGGELEVPLTGHVKKLEAKIKMNCIDETIADVTNEKSILIECKGAAQKMDKASQSPELYGIDATFKGLIKSIDGPKMKTGDKLEAAIDLSLTYYKLEINGKVILEIDILNNITNLHGVKNDAVRQLMGL